jgi:hypothetical protein
METQRKKSSSQQHNKNAAHGLRDLFAVGLQDIYYEKH